MFYSFSCLAPVGWCVRQWKSTGEQSGLFLTMILFIIEIFGWQWPCWEVNDAVQVLEWMAAVSVASNRFLHDEQVLTGALTWGGRVSTWTGRTFGRVSATTGTAAAVDDGAVGPRPRKVVHVDVRASVADGHVLETLRTTVSAAEDGPTSGG